MWELVAGQWRSPADDHTRPQTVWSNFNTLKICFFKMTSVTNPRLEFVQVPRHQGDPLIKLIPSLKSYFKQRIVISDFMNTWFWHWSQLPGQPMVYWSSDSLLVNRWLTDGLLVNWWSTGQLMAYWTTNGLLVNWWSQPSSLIMWIHTNVEMLAV